MVSASFVDRIVVYFLFLLSVICFTLMSGSSTAISWSGGRIVSGRAVTPVMFVRVSLSIGNPVLLFCLVLFSWSVSFHCKAVLFFFLLSLKMSFTFSSASWKVCFSLVTVAITSCLNCALDRNLCTLVEFFGTLWRHDPLQSIGNRLARSFGISFWCANSLTV